MRVDLINVLYTLFQRGKIHRTAAAGPDKIKNGHAEWSCAGSGYGTAGEGVPEIRRLLPATRVRALQVGRTMYRYSTRPSPLSLGPDPFPFHFSLAVNFMRNSIRLKSDLACCFTITGNIRYRYLSRTKLPLVFWFNKCCNCSVSLIFGVNRHLDSNPT